jgi:phospholipid-binding lipoprotein MlaA
MTRFARTKTVLRLALQGTLCAFLVALPALSRAADAVYDPWEGFNRRVFAFNEGLDRWALKPVAKGYQAITPDFVDTGVTNVFSNIGEVPALLNHALQWRWREAGTNGERLLLNSTLGLLGLFDVASKMGIERADTDAGLTFGHWGMGSGPYLVLPLLGPSSLRDGAGVGVNVLMSPLFRMEEERLAYSLRGLEAVDTRADLLEVEELIAGDRYTFLRNLYLQRRAFLLGGGEPPPAEFGEDEFGEFDEEF